MDDEFQIEAGAEGVLYCRVSSQKQAKGLSPEVQYEGGLECAQRYGIKLIREWRGVESAKEAGRQLFGEMIAFVKKHPKCKYILMPKVDRLSRNHYDQAAMDDLVDNYGKVFIFYHEGFIMHGNASLSDHIRLEASSMIARLENRHRQERARRSLRKKAANGVWPNKAPYGFINDKSVPGGIRVDPKWAPFIVRIKQLAATGRQSCEAIAALIWKEGSPVRLSKSAVHYILRNPIYFGFISYQDIFRKGLFEPIVEKALHDAAIAGLERFQRPKYQSHDFFFRGRIQCADCGCAVVFERKKQRYIYAHCTRRRPCASKGNVREEHLREEVERALLSLQLAPEVSERILRYLEETAPHASTKNATDLAVAQQALGRVKSALERANDLLCRGVIGEPEYIRQKREYEEQRAGLEEQIKKLEEASPASYMPLARAALELSNCCCELYKTMDDEKKRELLDSVCSNFLLSGEKLTPQWRKPFQLIAEMASCSNWLPG